MDEKIHNFKAGDILVSTWGYNRTITTWYKVIRTTRCKVFMEELPTAYPTPYMSNTPGDFCMPVVDGQIPQGYPFVGYTPDGVVSGRAGNFGDREYVRLPGRYGQFLYRWGGGPGWVNSD